MKLFYLSLIISSIWLSIDGLKVLGVLPFASRSHFAIGSSIMKSLLKAGHEVTVISPYPMKKPLKNYHDVDVSSVIEVFKKSQPNHFLLGQTSSIGILTHIYELGATFVDFYMQNSNVKEFMKSDQKFDVCFVELFNADALMGIAEHFDCVLITFTTFHAVKWIDDITSNHSPYSYVPHPFLSYTDQMTFMQRLENTFTSQVENFLYALIHLPNQRRLYNKYFPNAKRSFDDMYKNSAIIFMNNHVSSSSARPYLPNMIEIGGIHVERAKPLPKDIQVFLDSATDGVILFSMGSIIQAVQWPEEKREAFVKAFGKLKQKVLWKYENETLPNMPSNVMISPWIPQRDILAHPNVKLFITHGGLLGTTEALIEGIPVLGIPIFGDQKMNMAKAVAREYGLSLNFEDICESKLTEILQELLSNPKYDANAKEISSRFSDRPMSPQESVVYWTEYAVRHKGAPHLRAAGNSLSFIEFHLIDVYATLSLIGLIILFVNYLVLKFVLSKVFKKKMSFVQMQMKKKLN